MTDNITLPRQTAQQILAALRVAVTPVPKDRQEVLRLDAALQTALAQPIPTHRITSWGHCGVCRHDRIPGEGCARQECPDSPQQQAEPVAWDKTSASFNGWWDSYRHDPANPFAEGSAAYWAWAGWKAAQRQWVGLTDEDFCDQDQEWIAGASWAEAKLKERNND